jgi:hypothetical protein
MKDRQTFIRVTETSQSEVISNFPVQKFYEIAQLNENQFVVFFESGLELHDFDIVDSTKLVKRKESFQKVLFEFSCCGIDINCDNTMLAVGDLSG